MIEFSKICLQQNSIFDNFENLQKKILGGFYNVYKEKMFIIEIEDGREATKKPM